MGPPPPAGPSTSRRARAERLTDLVDSYGGTAAEEPRKPRLGRIWVGTSGFAYPGWAPAFYPPGTRGEELLPAYAARLPAVELSSTYYRSPTPVQVAAWAARVPADFRFTVKLQRERSRSAFVRGSASAVAALAEPLDGFGTRVGAALYRVSPDLPRDDDRLGSLLLRWPSGIPLAMELVHRSWHVDEVFHALRPFGAALVVTETDQLPEPPMTLTGEFLYLRLRRTAYGTADLDAWAARLEPFLADGRDAFVFFRHDEDGRTPGLATALAERLPRFDPRRQGSSAPLAREGGVA